MIRFSRKLCIAQKTIDVSSNGIGRHHKCCIDCMDIVAGYCTPGMSKQGCNRHFSEAEIICHAGKDMAQNMRCDIRKGGIFKNLLPDFGEP